MNEDHDDPDFRFRKPHWIEEIIQQLATINDKLDTMAETQAQFDAELQTFMTDIQTQTAAIDAAVQAVLNKVGTAVDLSAESATLKQATAALDTIAGQLPQTVTPPVPPVPGPAAAH